MLIETLDLKEKEKKKKDVRNMQSEKILKVTEK